MAETREVLEMMKEVARSRIRQLQEGVTFHDEARKTFYLREYAAKLHEINRLIRRLNLRLVRPDDT